MPPSGWRNGVRAAAWATGAGDPPRLDKGADGIASELEGVEPGHHVETVVGKGPVLQIALAEVTPGNPFAGDVQKQRSRVDSGHPGPKAGGPHGCQSGAAAAIQDPRSRPDTGPRQDVVIARKELAHLHLGPVARASPRDGHWFQMCAAGPDLTSGIPFGSWSTLPQPE